jgi:hypothetical protein
MKTIFFPDQTLTDGTFAATIGFFDGVHQGHRFLLENLRKEAAERGLMSLAITFERHPRQVVQKEWEPELLTELHEKLRLLKSTGIDTVAVLRFSKQMAALSAFVEKHKIKLLIPFSTNAPQLADNKYIYQVYQSHITQNSATIEHFVKGFKNYHTVIIDCNDSTSNKGEFTTALRRQLEQQNMTCNITNLKSGESDFSKAFSRTKPNVVILNTGRSPELGVAFSKLNGLNVTDPDLLITMFGYTEWLMYTRTHLENFYKFNTYIPSVFYYNPLSASTKRLQQKFRWNFHTDMQNNLPRFALTGFDHAYFFLMGLHREGRKFLGEESNPDYVQTPLQFERYGNGGLRNHTQLFVHYTRDSRVETIKF